MEVLARLSSENHLLFFVEHVGNVDEFFFPKCSPVIMAHCACDPKDGSLLLCKRQCQMREIDPRDVSLTSLAQARKRATGLT
jgi:hypothetical protein